MSNQNRQEEPALMLVIEKPLRVSSNESVSLHQKRVSLNYAKQSIVVAVAVPKEVDLGNVKVIKKFVQILEVQTLILNS